MRITALAGGIGGARFLRGLLAHLRSAGQGDTTEVTVIGNTADDITLFGLPEATAIVKNRKCYVTWPVVKQCFL